MTAPLTGYFVSFIVSFCYVLFCHRFGPYFVEPIIAGLHPKTYEPYIASCDLIGCPNEPEDFVVSGTCADQLYGEINLFSDGQRSVIFSLSEGLCC